MKYLSGCIAVALILSACGPKNKSAPGAPAKKTAVDADGNCTPAVLADYETLRSDSKSLLESVVRDLADIMDDAKKAAATDRMSAAVKGFQAKADGFRNTYGDFTCRAQSGGMITHLNPAPIYKSLDELKAKMAELNSTAPSGPVGRDGDCAPQFATDHKQMQDGLKVELKPMMDALQSMMRKSQSGMSIDQEKLIIKTSIRSAVKTIETFRTSHPGIYACNVTDSAGKKMVVSSEQIDTQLQNLRQQSQNLN